MEQNVQNRKIITENKTPVLSTQCIEEMPLHYYISVLWLSQIQSFGFISFFLHKDNCIIFDKSTLPIMSYPNEE